MIKSTQVHMQTSRDRRKVKRDERQKMNLEKKNSKKNKK